MKSKSIAIILSLLPLICQGKLPTVSSELINQLKNWELDKQVTLQQEVKEKREQAVVRLQEYIEATAKTGDLDGALAIRELIKEMGQPVSNGSGEVDDLKGNEISMLPKNAQTLLARLAEWETEQEANLEKEILVKRKQVVDVLKNQLQDTTKQGNLDGAVAIKEKIADLSLPGMRSSGVRASIEVKPGQLWTGIHPTAGGEWTIKLHSEGKATFKHGRIQNRLWAFEPPNILYCWHPNQTKTTGWKLTIDSSGVKAKLNTTKDGGIGEAKLKDSE